MAEDIKKKRITEYDEATSFGDDDYIFVDSSSTGTRKVKGTTIKSSLTTDAQIAAIEAKGAAVKNSIPENYSKLINDVDNLQDDFNSIFIASDNKNLFNYNDCELGDFNSAGNEIDSTSVMRTVTMIPFTGSQIASNYSCRKIYYDSTGNFIVRSASNRLDDVPEGAAYVRFSINSSYYANNDVMCNTGASVLPYEPYDESRTINDDSLEKTSLSKKVNSIETEFYALSPESKSVNLFNYNDCELGDFNSAGNEVDSTSVMRTKSYVPINGSVVVSNYGCRKIFFKDDLTPILRSASTADPVEIPANAKYVRFSISKAQYDAHTDVMINVGEEKLAYQPFEYFRTINETSLYNSIKDSEQICSLFTNDEHLHYSELYKVFKRVGVVGDSLSVGYMNNPAQQITYERNLPYSWPKCIGRDANADWLNFGKHGLNVLTWCTNDTYGKVQMEAENTKCQLYIIGLGVNDVNDIPVGSSADIVDNPDTVATTYYGGYARIIQLIKRRNANAKIICLTNPTGESSSKKPFNDAVRYIAGTKYTASDNVFLLDMATEYGNLFTTPGLPLYIDKEAVSHYSAEGYQIISKIMERGISKVMQDNYLNFLDIPFIEYDTGTPPANTMTE